MRILLIEDDDQIADFITQGLQEAGYAVDHTGDGEEGYRYARNASYAAAVIDLMLPRRDGLDIIQNLRKRGVDMPVLILSAKRSTNERVEGLRAGGDDYLTKPFAFTELLARVRALIRRSSGHAESTELVAGPLTMNLLDRDVRRSGTAVELQPREFALLELLMRNRGQVVSKTMILEHVWDFNFTPQTNVVEVLVHRLRSSIDKPFDQKLIHTVRGAGYVLRVDE